MRKRKVAIIGTVGIPAKYGGFEKLAEHLVTDLHHKYDMTVYCTAKKYAKAERIKTYRGARLIYLPIDANGVLGIVYACISILHAIFYADVLVVLGVSGGFMLPFVRIFTSKKIVTSIDGMEWKREKSSKPARPYLWVAEWMAVKFSHASITDNEASQDYTAIRYNKLSSIIEYGADHTLKVKPTREHLVKYPFLMRPYACNVCRIEPENNVHLMLEAFSLLPRQKLVVIGNWNNSAFGKELRSRFSHFQHLILMDPVYDQRELDVIRGNCYVYIHGNSEGGTNPSLVEAMFLELPVIAFDVAYNRKTTGGKAFYFKSVGSLVDILVKKKLSDYKMLAEIMKSIAYRRYTWKVIALKYAFLLETVLSPSNDHELVPQVIGKVSYAELLKYRLGHLQADLAVKPLVF